MPHSGSSDNLNKSVRKEVKNGRINIVKVDSDSWVDSTDEDEVSGEFSGTLYKDDNGNVFIYISQIDGVDVEKLRGDGSKDGKRSERKRDDSDDEDPKDAGEALDLFIIENGRNSREPQMETQNAPPGYRSV